MDMLPNSRHHVVMETNQINMDMLTEAALMRRRDLSVLWHPCTQMAEHPDTLPLIPIRRGRGVWLEGVDGKRYLDAVSSWWTNLFGHAEPRIAAAIAAQAHELEHVIYAGFSHEPGLKLAEALIAAAPDGLSRVFYADNGSAAVEIALKMSFHHFYNRGDFNRTKFISLHNGYHGETLGALSMGDIPLYRKVYAPLLLEPLFAPSPDAYDSQPDESAEHYALRMAEKLAALFEQHDGEICALILEPLVQCAGGMRMHHAAYLKRAREICTQHGAHLIADEIAVGFGRTGTLFACEQAGISPDFMCLSKGLTGGFMPMSAVLTTQHVYESFLDVSRERAFLHSHSYTGNPLACAAALASLTIFNSDHVLEKNKITAHKMAAHAEIFKQHAHVAEVRQTGMILAIEMVQDKKNKTPFAASERRGLRAYQYAIANGVVLRPLGDVLYWMPPYCIDDEALQYLSYVTASALHEATR
jgi:adenosylmethionine---8-amino-7-oxononanoate aminotransferase